MTDLKAAVLSSLAHVPACTALSFAREEPPLPIITVAEESASVAAQADAMPYLTEHVLRIDVYAATQAETETLFHQADEALTALGLKLTQAQDLYDDPAYAWRKSARYRCLEAGGIIYQ